MSRVAAAMRSAWAGNNGEGALSAIIHTTQSASNGGHKTNLPTRPNFWKEGENIRNLWNGYAVSTGGERIIGFSLDRDTGKLGLAPVQGGLFTGSFPGLLSSYQFRAAADVVLSISWVKNRNSDTVQASNITRTLTIMDRDCDLNTKEGEGVLAKIRECYPALDAWLVPVDENTRSYLAEPIHWPTRDKHWGGPKGFGNMFDTSGMVPSALGDSLHQFLANLALRTSRTIVVPGGNMPVYSLNFLPVEAPDVFLGLKLPFVTKEMIAEPVPEVEFAVVLGLSRKDAPAICLNPLDVKVDMTVAEACRQYPEVVRALLVVCRTDGTLRIANYSLPWARAPRRA